MLTKNEPIQKTYNLTTDGVEHVTETVIENFEPYSRVIYVLAETNRDAQLKLYGYMWANQIQDWKDIKDGTILN